MSNHQIDFEAALGESFGEHVSPPVPFEDASAHECCEVIRLVLGNTITPERLAKLDGSEVFALAHRFGEYFECEPPSDAQVRASISRTLARWPIGSLGEDI